MGKGRARLFLPTSGVDICKDTNVLAPAAGNMGIPAHVKCFCLFHPICSEGTGKDETVPTLTEPGMGKCLAI